MLLGQHSRSICTRKQAPGGRGMQDRCSSAAMINCLTPLRSLVAKLSVGDMLWWVRADYVTSLRNLPQGMRKQAYSPVRAHSCMLCVAVVWRSKAGAKHGTKVPPSVAA